MHPRAPPRPPAGGDDPRGGADRRPAAGRARTGVRRDLRPLRPDDRGGGVPVHGRGRPDPGRAAGRRWGGRPRPGWARRVRLAERHQRPAPDGCVLQHRGNAARRAWHPDPRRRPGLRRAGAGQRRDRASGRHRRPPLPSAPRWRQGHRRGRAPDRTSATCAAGTGSSSPRTRPSARSTTGSRTTCRRSARCCGSRPGGSRRAAGARPWRRRSGGSGRSRSSTRSCRGTPATRSTSTRSSCNWCGWRRRGCSRATAEPRFRVRGDGGVLPADVVTPLGVVLTELLTNAAEHAFPPGWSQPEGAHVQVSLSNTGEELVVQVHDNGVGWPDDFDIATSRSLGLSIARSLVLSQLNGTIDDVERFGGRQRAPDPAPRPGVSRGRASRGPMVGGRVSGVGCPGVGCRGKPTRRRAVGRWRSVGVGRSGALVAWRAGPKYPSLRFFAKIGATEHSCRRETI